MGATLKIREYHIMSNYGEGWEHETTNFSKYAADEELNLYHETSTGSHRIRVRVVDSLVSDESTPKFTNSDFNLDGMTLEDIRVFICWSKTGMKEKAKFFFPETPKGYYATFQSIILMAMDKRDAMSARIAGNIERALKIESRIDKYFNMLPEFARW